MAAECENFCPRIIALEVYVSTAELFSVVDGRLGLDSSRMEALNRAIIESESCAGPITEIQTVQRGIIHKSTVQEEVLVCGLKQNPIPKTAPITI